MDQTDKLSKQLLHARAMEIKAARRVARASTILISWQRKRERLEHRIGAAEVRKIVDRLTQAGK
jgi:hypothetical protein